MKPLIIIAFSLILSYSAMAAIASGPTIIRLVNINHIADSHKSQRGDSPQNNQAGELATYSSCENCPP